jgi:hypothetical protein
MIENIIKIMNDRKKEQLQRAEQLLEFLNGIWKNDKSIRRDLTRKRIKKSIDSTEKLIRVLKG